MTTKPTGAQLRALGWEGPAIGTILQLDTSWNPEWISDLELLAEIATHPEQHVDHPDLDQAIYLQIMSRRKKRRKPTRKLRPNPVTVNLPLTPLQIHAAEVILERWNASRRNPLWKRLIEPPERDWTAPWTPERAGHTWSRGASRHLQLRVTEDGLEISNDWPGYDFNRTGRIILSLIEQTLAS